MEILILLGALVAIGAWAYRSGKRVGSRKAYGVGLSGRAAGAVLGTFSEMRRASRPPRWMNCGQPGCGNLRKVDIQWAR
jgi:hypothetical protein